MSDHGERRCSPRDVGAAILRAEDDEAREMIKKATPGLRNTMVDALLTIAEARENNVENRIKASYLLKDLVDTEALQTADAWRRLEDIIKRANNPDPVVGEIVDVVERLVFSTPSRRERVRDFPLLLAHRGEDTKVRWARLLGTMEDEWAVQELDRLAKSPTRSGEWALRTLAEMRCDAAREALQRHAEDEQANQSLASELLLGREKAQILERALDAVQRKTQVGQDLLHALVEHRKFAVLCKIVDRALITEDGLRTLVDLDLPEASLSRSQRKFYRRLGKISRSRLGH